MYKDTAAFGKAFEVAILSDEFLVDILYDAGLAEQVPALLDVE